MNRDYALKRRYEARIASLTPWQGLAFACAGIEHALPTWQRHPAAVPAREALDYLWTAAYSSQGDPVIGSRLRKQLADAIPHADDEPGVEGSLVRIGGVMVLDALAFVLTADVRALCRCCGGHFDVFNYAVDLYLHRDPGWWEELGEFEQADPVFAEEWQVQQVLLAEVESWTDGRHVLEWRNARRERGLELATYFRIPSRPAQ